MLLDEIEKAHTEVFDVLLQILDDGRLTDGQGRTVDFRNTVIIMTSNVRSAEAMREFFRPEFLNRIDEIVEFQALTREQLAEIVELQLAPAARAARRARVSLELTDAAKELVAEAGWDPTYGARPLKRALQRLVENPLALRLLEVGWLGGGGAVFKGVRGLLGGVDAALLRRCADDEDIASSAPSFGSAAVCPAGRRPPSRGRGRRARAGRRGTSTGSPATITNVSSCTWSAWRSRASRRDSARGSARACVIESEKRATRRPEPSSRSCQSFVSGEKTV